MRFIVSGLLNRNIILTITLIWSAAACRRKREGKSSHSKRITIISREGLSKEDVSAQKQEKRRAAFRRAPFHPKRRFKNYTKPWMQTGTRSDRYHFPDWKLHPGLSSNALPV